MAKQCLVSMLPNGTNQMMLFSKFMEAEKVTSRVGRARMSHIFAYILECLTQ